jgi:squalene-hopene/tetraprenyl-beta-curcumene cyclase
MTSTTTTNLAAAYARARAELLRQRNVQGWWTGELSVSPLATATAVVALHLCDPAGNRSFVERGLAFLKRTQNADGGWGDTLKSFSNISTTMLANAAFQATKNQHDFRSDICEGAKQYIESKGGIPGLKARYGKDKTFSVPILTCCALAGVVDWKQIPRLPFELACLPPQFYKTVKLPVVSYALPALIAIGQVRHHHGFQWFNPLHLVRELARKPTLRRLESLQPSNGGFLEATPLTAFVTMSLAGMGLANHPVAKKGVEFLKSSIRDDGGWPIDTNLSTWVTTLSINALGDDLDGVDKEAIREWLLSQQYKTVHPYTNADPGGWAWTDRPGGVPDADDTAGALLALSHLGETDSIKVLEAAENGVRWLLSLQNRDGGWPTFCRGWGTLPFDRSSPDITAHALRAIARWRTEIVSWKTKYNLPFSMDQATDRGFQYLYDNQRNDYSWVPLWFGNQHEDSEENSVYGTSRVLLAGFDDPMITDSAKSALFARQLADGGWGSLLGGSSTEETALAVEAIASIPEFYFDKARESQFQRGLDHLTDRVLSGQFAEPAPIGFYFAKLWYFERLYPIIWTVGALRRALGKRRPANEGVTA